MALERSGTILYVAKISYQTDNWFGNCYEGTKTLQRQTHTHTHIHTHTHTQTDTHTHTKAYFKSPVFLRKCRNKTKNSANFSF